MKEVLLINMPFDATQTYENLARAFAGECQAGMRYQLTAKIAMREGFYTLADTIRSIAKNETVHATTFFRHILNRAGSADNIRVDAGYPFHLGTLAESLLFAADDEREEAERIYPAFAKTAKEEGFEDIAGSFERIAAIEDNHRIIFTYLGNAVRDGTLYKSEQSLVWICSECGYMHTGKEAWQTCPVCKKEQGYVELHLPFDYLNTNGIKQSFVEQKEGNASPRGGRDPE